MCHVYLCVCVCPTVYQCPSMCMCVSVCLTMNLASELCRLVLEAEMAKVYTSFTEVYSKYRYSCLKIKVWGLNE